MTGCGYCGKKGTSEFCSSECRIRYDEYIGRVEKYSKLFLVCLFVPMFLFLLPVFVGHAMLITGIVVIMDSLVLMVMPFGTPQTVGAFGVRSSIRTVRAIGAALFIWGLLLVVISVLL